MALGGFVAGLGPSFLFSPVAAGLAATPEALISLGVALLKTLTSSLPIEVVFLKAIAASNRSFASDPKLSSSSNGGASLKPTSVKSGLRRGFNCISRAILRNTDVWWFAFPISCKEVWIANIASAGNSNSSALSSVRTRGIMVSSQNCCNLLVALSSFFAAGETLAATTASVLGHHIHRESRTPFLVAFNFLLSFSNFEPNTVSRNTAPASDRLTSWPISSISASPSSSSGSRLSSGFRFFGGGFQCQNWHLSQCDCTANWLAAPLCVAPHLSVLSSSCGDLMLPGNDERFLTLSDNSARVFAISSLIVMSTHVDGCHSQIKSQ